MGGFLRGFNGRFANKLLVLIDGRGHLRSLGSAGVFWDAQDGVTLEDIERIEVIRGPGATVWGANAVNGVINIITRHTDQTQGIFAAGTLGTEERLLGTARVGSDLGTTGHFRATGEFARRGATAELAGEPNGDGWDVWRTSGRADLHLTDTDDLTLRANYNYDEAYSVYPVAQWVAPYERDVESTMRYGSGSLQVGWQRRLGPDARIELLAYVVGESIDDSLTVADRRSYDFELRHAFAAGRRHSLIWGAGYRATADDFEVGLTEFVPPSQTADLTNVFIQDDIALRQDRLRLVLGSKLEHSWDTGSEIQPNARLVWTPNADHTAWAAVSRAVRTPSRYEQSISYYYQTIPAGTPANPGTLPIILQILGNPDLPPEVVVAYEAGYRMIPSASVSADLALFYNVYDNLRSNLAEALIPVLDGVPHVVMPIRMGDTIEAETRGAELSVEWRAHRNLRLHGAYSYYDEERRLRPAIRGSALIT